MPKLPTESEQLAVIKKAITLTLKQGERSVAPNGACMYRSPNGLRCAVGQLINDEHYHSDLEDSKASVPWVKLALLKSLGFVIDDNFSSELSNIQAAHDGAEGEQFKEDFVFLLKRSQGFPLLTKALKELNL